MNLLCKYSLLLGLFIIISSCAVDERTADDLPILGGQTLVYSSDSTTVDSVYHSVPFFEFLDQDSLLISSENLKNKVYVVDFFFTSCPSICPLMTRQMNRLRQMCNADKVTLISFTVDPKRDTPKRLNRYVEENNLIDQNWHFLSGEANDIYQLGWHGFKLSMAENIDSPGGFIHSEKFVLIDQNNHIRGFYDGTNTTEVAQLAKDIMLLL